ncbi:TlpA family protein disulfide reductase [Jiulongibacter sp. NS-SX5]|uniref:TlpA family protein disulfide reductase n=1 Tax=Jiulongibacter sp. NS-SX5 TaxID=3463854 RepID=UPI004058C65D
MTKRSILLLLAITIVHITKGQSIYLAHESDPYLLSCDHAESNVLQFYENEEYATFIKDFEEQFGEDFNSETQYEALKSLNVDEWEMKLFEARNKQLGFLKNHESYAEFSADFVELTMENINYNYWHLLLAYAINRSNENTKSLLVNSLPSIMTEALNPERIDNQSLLASKSFRAFLPYFVTYFNSKENRFKKYSDGVQSVTDKAEFAERQLSGKVLDYTLTLLLEKYHGMLSLSAFRVWSSQIYCDELRTYLGDQYYDVVAAKEEELAKQKQEVERLEQNLPNIMDLNDKTFTFDKYKGKVIYVDFWASWCGPCRAEFPASREMHANLSSKEKKKIVFLYISIDEDLDKWRAAVEKLGLDEFGENGHSYEVSTKYKVKSIPRYMIIDQKGNVVNDNAPRPSNSETLPQLLELL